MSGLRDQWNNCDTGVTTNHGDVLIGWVVALDLRHKARSSDDIESGNSEKSLGVVDALGLVNFSADWDGRVDLEVADSVSYQCKVFLKECVYRPGWR